MDEQVTKPRRTMTDDQKAKMAAGRVRARQAKATAAAVAPEQQATHEVKGDGRSFADSARTSAILVTQIDLEPNSDRIPAYTKSAFDKKDTDYFVYDPTAQAIYPEPEKNIRTHSMPLKVGAPAIPFHFSPGRPTRMPREYALRFLRDVFVVVTMEGVKIETPPNQLDAGEIMKGGRKLDPNETIANLGELSDVSLFNRCKRQPNSEGILLKSGRGEMIRFLVGVSILEAKPRPEVEVPHRSVSERWGVDKKGNQILLGPHYVQEASPIPQAEVANPGEVDQWMRGVNLGDDVQIEKAA